MENIAGQPSYKMVDTCAAEFPATTPYFYSTWETDCEICPSDERKVLILGSGPIRIGQGIEFDYCTVHAVKALREEGVEVHIVNNNPETVSTDFDTSDRLFFEPMHLEDVMNILKKDDYWGVMVQFGGQNSINLAVPLEKEIRRLGIPTRILGTSPDAMDIAEDRDRFSEFLDQLQIPSPPNCSAYSEEEAFAIAERIGYPVLVRPSYVLGGRAMEIVHDSAELATYMKEAVRVSRKHPVLIDLFLQNAIEIDVDAVCDGEEVLIGGIMEHIEEAGVHSGDSACVIPTQSLTPSQIDPARGLYPADRPGPRGCRAREHPVRHQGRHGLCPRGKPPGEPDGPLRLQGDRHPPRQGRGEGDDGEEDRGPRATRSGRSATWR